MSQLAYSASNSGGIVKVTFLLSHNPISSKSVSWPLYHGTQRTISICLSPILPSCLNQRRSRNEDEDFGFLKFRTNNVVQLPGIFTSTLRSITILQASHEEDSVKDAPLPRIRHLSCHPRFRLPVAQVRIPAILRRNDPLVHLLHLYLGHPHTRIAQVQLQYHVYWILEQDEGFPWSVQSRNADEVFYLKLQRQLCTHHRLLVLRQ